jgi:hypothetical protein
MVIILFFQGQVGVACEITKRSFHFTVNSFIFERLLGSFSERKILCERTSSIEQKINGCGYWSSELFIHNTGTLYMYKFIAYITCKVYLCAI